MCLLVLFLECMEPCFTLFVAKHIILYIKTIALKSQWTSFIRKCPTKHLQVQVAQKPSQVYTQN